MRYLKGVAAAAICTGLVAMSATAANAATVMDCLHSAHAVKAALAKHQDSPNLNDAKRQDRYGLGYCNNGMYKQGVAHYHAALKILGEDNKS